MLKVLKGLKSVKKGGNLPPCKISLIRASFVLPGLDRPRGHARFSPPLAREKMILTIYWWACALVLQKRWRFFVVSNEKPVVCSEVSFWARPGVGRLQLWHWKYGFRYFPDSRHASCSMAIQLATIYFASGTGLSRWGASGRSRFEDRPQIHNIYLWASPRPGVRRCVLEWGAYTNCAYIASRFCRIRIFVFKIQRHKARSALLPVDSRKHNACPIYARIHVACGWCWPYAGSAHTAYI